MKFEISLGHGDTLVIEDVDGQNPNKLVTVKLTNNHGQVCFSGGIAKMEDIKRLAKGMK